MLYKLALIVRRKFVASLKIMYEKHFTIDPFLLIWYFLLFYMRLPSCHCKLFVIRHCASYFISFDTWNSNRMWFLRVFFLPLANVEIDTLKLINRPFKLCSHRLKSTAFIGRNFFFCLRITFIAELMAFYGTFARHLDYPVTLCINSFRTDNGHALWT